MKKVLMLLLLLLAVTVRVSANSAAPVDRVTELQDAALNYEAAANAQLSLANSLLQSKQTDEPNETDPEITRRRRNRNATLELQAVDQLMGASGNLDHAARVWLAAAQSKIEPATKAYFQRLSRNATQKATALLRQSAELAENAALEYASAGEPRSQSNASHRAGRIREQLAGRR
ncbi:MAG: hypothetical protein ACNA71_04380 [Kiritimatiellia bacterium]